LLFDRTTVAAALVLLGAAFALAGCGRSGALEPPPGPALAQPSAATGQAASVAPSSTVGGPVASGPTALETAQRNGFDANGNPVAPPGPKKSFILDPLLQ
jgi:predicted small lipoprotein YifL